MGLSIYQDTMENMAIQPQTNFKGQLFMKNDFLKSAVKFSLVTILATVCCSSEDKDSTKLFF